MSYPISLLEFLARYVWLSCSGSVIFVISRFIVWMSPSWILLNVASYKFVGIPAQYFALLLCLIKMSFVFIKIFIPRIILLLQGRTSRWFCGVSRTIYRQRPHLQDLVDQSLNKTLNLGKAMIKLPMALLLDHGVSTLGMKKQLKMWRSVHPGKFAWSL